MAIFAIADLHLSFNENKPMNIFGEKWQNHEEKIKQDWLNGKRYSVITRRFFMVNVFKRHKSRF